jgi:hypothetical protein
MFFENGIHVSQEGHDEIAHMIFDKTILESFIDLFLPENK